MRGSKEKQGLTTVLQSVIASEGNIKATLTVLLDVNDEYPLFVIQKHAASRLHYDFRLEVDGVFKSWAIPKGPSTDPKQKRLAIPVEDHSMSYGDFEGVLDEGQYGAGTVLVWDRGAYRNLTRSNGADISITEALEKGRAVLWLEGGKLRGGYTLMRVGSQAERRWLLIKRRDEAADPHDDLLQTRPESILTGRTIEEIAAEE